MLTQSSTSRFPRGSFVWIAIEGGSAPATLFGLTRKALRTHKTIKNLSVQEKGILLSLEPSNWITWIPSQVSRQFFFFPVA